MGYYEEGRTVTGYDTDSYEKSHPGNIIACSVPIRVSREAEGSEGCDCRVTKAEVLTCQKFLRQQVDPCNRRVVYKIPERTTQKTSKSMGGRSRRAIPAKMEKKGEIEKEMEVHCGQQCG